MQVDNRFQRPTTKIPQPVSFAGATFDPQNNQHILRMKTAFITLSVCLSIFATTTFLACKKEDNGGGGNACNGMNFCMKVDGTTVSKNAKWKVLSNRNRILWEEGTGASYVNVELDLYGSATGTYTISPTPGAANSAGFQYFMGTAVGNKNIVGQSGTVTVSAISGTTMTGTFNVVGKDAAGTTYTITDGNFIAVPQ